MPLILMPRRTAVLALALPVLLLGGCGKDGDTTTGPGDGSGIAIPAEWLGVWTIMTTTQNCDGTNQVTDTSTESFCPDDELTAPDDGEIPEEYLSAINCTGSADANSFTQSCSGTLQVNELGPGCTVSFTSTQSGTRTGDSYSGSGHVEITFTNCGDFNGTICTDFDYSATRDPEATPDCPGTTARRPQLVAIEQLLAENGLTLAR